MLKKILIPMATKSADAEPLGRTHMARGTYIKKVLAAGLVPFFVSPFTPKDMLNEILSQSSGVLLMGGEDINPKYYGAIKHPKTQIIDPDRDAFELSLVKSVLEIKKPLLGICRGIQVMAVVSGGTLIQHIPDLKLNEEHGLGEGKTYDDVVNSAGHLVKVAPSSRLVQIIGQQEFTVNSAHHQAVDTLGTDFIISAKSPEGIVEVIEHKDTNYFAFGVQSHPEAHTGALEHLFQAFFQICRA